MKKTEFDKCLDLVERYITQNPKCDVYRNTVCLGNIFAQTEELKSDDNAKNVIIKIFDVLTFAYTWQTETDPYYVEIVLHNESDTIIMNPTFPIFEYIMNKYYSIKL